MLNNLSYNIGNNCLCTYLLKLILRLIIKSDFMIR